MASVQLVGKAGTSVLMHTILSNAFRESEECRASGAGEVKTFSTEELFGKGKAVLIRHKDALYRLMITRQGKLILNK